MKSRGVGIWIAFGILTLLGMFWFDKAILRPEAFTKSQALAKFYYRMKVSLTVDKVEPLDIDFIAACHLSITTYRDNDKTVYVGRYPRVYTVSTKNGNAVQVTIPEQPCRTGQTSDNHGGQSPGRDEGSKMSGVPPDYFPLIVWYESKNDLSLGIAYASEDAYDSPASRLTFHGAKIHRGTEEEYKNFQLFGRPNLIPPDAQVSLVPTLPNAVSQALERQKRLRVVAQTDPKNLWRSEASLTCQGYSRLEVSAQLSEILRKHRPEGSRFWRPMGEAADEVAGYIEKYRTSGQPQHGFRSRPDEPGRYLRSWEWAEDSRPTTTITKRNGGGHISSVGDDPSRPIRYRFPPVYIPWRLMSAPPWANLLTEPPETTTYILEIGRPELEGMLYCFNILGSIGTPTPRNQGMEINKSDGEILFRSTERKFHVHSFYEEDKYIYQYVRIFL